MSNQKVKLAVAKKRNSQLVGFMTDNHDITCTIRLLDRLDESGMPALQPPREADAIDDLTNRISWLCGAISASTERKMAGVRIRFDESEAIYLESVRCWRRASSSPK